MQYIPYIPLQPVDAVTINILADNLYDRLLPDQGPAKRPIFGSGVPRVAAPLMEGKDSFSAILAQHGFSALVSLTQQGHEHQILFDTGVSTGFRAIHRLASMLPDAFIQSSVGTRFEL